MHRDDSPVEGEFADDLWAWCESEDWRIGGALSGGVVRDETTAGEDDEFGSRYGVGELDAGGDGFLASIVEECFAVESRSAAFFDSRGHFIEYFDAFEGVFTGGGFAGKHDGVGLLEDGVGHIGDLGPGWHGG